MPRIPQKFPPKEVKSGMESDVEKYDDVLDSLNSLQTKHKKYQPESESSIKPTTMILVIVIISIFSIVLLSFGSGPRPSGEVGIEYLFGSFEAGTNLTDGLNFQFELLDESTVMLSDYIGEPIILDFFATWCSPCLTQIGHLQSVHSQYPNVKILSISIDLSDTRTMLTSYKADNSMDWVVGRDITRQAGSIYETISIPTMAFFDSDAKLQHWEVGVTDAVTLIGWINGY